MGEAKRRRHATCRAATGDACALPSSSPWETRAVPARDTAPGSEWDASPPDEGMRRHPQRRPAFALIALALALGAMPFDGAPPSRRSRP